MMVPFYASNTIKYSPNMAEDTTMFEITCILVVNAEISANETLILSKFNIGNR